MSELIILDNKHPSVQYLCEKDKHLAKAISMIGPITYQPIDDGYAFLIHEIIEQMLSVKAGNKIYSRLNDKCNGKICPEAISKLKDEDIKSTGTSQNKVLYIRNLTNSINDNSLSLNDLCNLSDQDVIKSLTRIKGIGNWTAKMYLIFVLNSEDTLPFEDAAFLQSYKWLYDTTIVDKESICKKCNKWKPYSSIASRYLYRALDLGLTKHKFYL